MHVHYPNDRKPRSTARWKPLGKQMSVYQDAACPESHALTNIPDWCRANTSIHMTYYWLTHCLIYFTMAFELHAAKVSFNSSSKQIHVIIQLNTEA